MTDKVYPVLVGHCSECKVPMMSKDRWTRMGRQVAAIWYPGFKPKGGHGHCVACWQRKKRAKPARPRSTRTCSLDGCDKPHDARGLCGAHYMAARKRGDFEPKQQLSAEEVLDDWALIRDAGETDLRRAASRIGMTHKALDQALYRARKRGDQRGSLVPYAHDMRRNAA